MAGDHPASKIHAKARDRALSRLADEQAAHYALLLAAQRLVLSDQDLTAKARADRARAGARAELREIHADRYWELYDEIMPALHAELGTTEGDRSRLARHRRQRARQRARRGQSRA